MFNTGTEIGGDWRYIGRATIWLPSTRTDTSLEMIFYDIMSGGERTLLCHFSFVEIERYHLSTGMVPLASPPKKKVPLRQPQGK